MFIRAAVAAALAAVQPGVRRYSQFGAEVRSDGETKEGRPRVEFAISTGKVARDNHTIDPTGWALENYRKNPVVQWCHTYWGEMGLPVGSSEREWVADGALRSVAVFAPKDLYPFGHTVGRMYQEGLLHAVSVGWDPLEYVVNEARGGVDFKRQELLEYSAVPVPADPDALKKASAQRIDLLPYRSWLERALDGEQLIAIPRAQAEALWGACGERRIISVPAPVARADVRTEEPLFVLVDEEPALFHLVPDQLA